MSDNINELRGLWRGKDVDGGMWVSGDLLQIPELDKHGKIVGTKPAIMERTPVAKCYYVDPSTLGECSGVYDNDNTPIFEGDILSLKYEIENVCQYQVKWDQRNAEFIAESTDGFSYICGVGYIARRDFVVIGNIYDNSELLKGGK